MVKLLILHPQVGKWLMKPVNLNECVMSEQNVLNDDVFISLSLEAFSVNKHERHSKKKGQINRFKFAQVQNSLFIFTQFFLPSVIPRVPTVAKPGRGSCGQRGAEELHQQRAHL